MPFLPAIVLAAPTAVEAPAATSTASPPPAAPQAPHLRAVRTPTPPVLDGKLDDPVWQLAPAGTGFRQKVPVDGGAPSEPTTVRVLYDDDAVYVAFDCPQRTPVTRRLTRRDRWAEADSVTLDLGTRGDHKSTFSFSVNAAGTLSDGIRFNDTDYSQDWDENWDAKTDVSDRGWTAEFKIPLRVLRFPSLPVQSWDLQANRYISAKQENDDWAYFPRSLGGEVSHYGRLDDLTGLHARTPLELRPFVVGRLRRRDPTVGQLASGTDVSGSVGLDAKWHPTPDLTLDVTLNPDFAQVEADQVVLNLSTAPTYYPEKRPFFLEGIDALTTPFKLLYTRRIGRVPPVPVLRTDALNDEQLVDVPEPTTIYGATKLTGRLGQHWSIGTVQAVTATNDVQVQLADGTRVARRLDPVSAFNVVRLKRDLGDNAHVAFMATAVTHAEATDAYPLLTTAAGYPIRSQLCPLPLSLTPLQSTTVTLAPHSRCTNDAYVAGSDWKWRSSDGAWSWSGQVAGSVLENGPIRPVADGTRIHPGDVGWGVKSNLNKEGGKHWVGFGGVDFESRAFEIEDLGYNERANQLSESAEVEYRDMDPSGAFLEHHTGLYYGQTQNFDGLLVGQGLYLWHYGHLSNFWWYNADAHYRGTKFDDREVGDGTALERDGRVGSEVSFTTDSTKPVVFGIDQNTEAIWDGMNMSGNLTLSVKPLPQLDFDVLPNWQWTNGEPRFVSTGVSAGQYLFGKLDAKSVGVTLRTTYTFTPRLTLQGYAQLFLASGHYSELSQFQAGATQTRAQVHLADLTGYTGPAPGNPDFEEGVLNVNLVLRWEYMLGSTLYVVYTRAQVPSTVLGPTDVGTLNLGAVGKAPTSDAALVKLSFWWGP